VDWEIAATLDKEHGLPGGPRAALCCGARSHASAIERTGLVAGVVLYQTATSAIGEGRKNICSI
jgi:hypothetical protein